MKEVGTFIKLLDWNFRGVIKY